MKAFIVGMWVLLAMVGNTALGQPTNVTLTMHPNSILRPIPDLLYGSQITWWGHANGIDDHPPDHTAYAEALTQCYLQ